MTEDLYRGRGWARAGFWLGSLASVAGNVSHAYINPEPAALVVGFAVLTPIVLIICIEIIAQVQWRRVWAQTLTRWGAVGAVAVISFAVSYNGIRLALLHHGESQIGAALMPAMLDGLMIVSSMALLTIGANVRQAMAAAGDRPAQPEIVRDGNGDRPSVPAQVGADTAPDSRIESKGDRSPVPLPETNRSAVPAELAERAAEVAAEHYAATGKPITRDELARTLRIRNARAGEVMSAAGLRLGEGRLLVTSLNGHR